LVIWRTQKSRCLESEMGHRGLSKHDVEEKKRRDDRIRKLHAQGVAYRWIVPASVGGAVMCRTVRFRS
jgi:hypothetical protein